jgi:hypothetical protein
MTNQGRLRFRCLLLLWALFFASGLVPQPIFGYDAHPRTNIVHDGASLPVFDYDSASTPCANKSENRISEDGGFFAQFAQFLAAEKTADLYRAVGVREFDSVMANKAFQAGGNSMSARQFGFTMEEALKFAAETVLDGLAAFYERCYAAYPYVGKEKQATNRAASLPSPARCSPQPDHRRPPRMPSYGARCIRINPLTPHVVSQSIGNPEHTY